LTRNEQSARDGRPLSRRSFAKQEGGSGDGRRKKSKNAREQGLQLTRTGTREKGQKKMPFLLREDFCLCPVAQIVEGKTAELNI